MTYYTTILVPLQFQLKLFLVPLTLLDHYTSYSHMSAFANRHVIFVGGHLDSLQLQHRSYFGHLFT
jgi:hypothetical protein